MLGLNNSALHVCCTFVRRTTSSYSSPLTYDDLIVSRGRSRAAVGTGRAGFNKTIDITAMSSGLNCLISSSLGACVTITGAMDIKINRAFTMGVNEALSCRRRLKVIVSGGAFLTTMGMKS